MPLNGKIRKAIGKNNGDKIRVVLELDDRRVALSHDLMICLKEDFHAMSFFKTLPPSHQQYFSKWIEGAKTANTKSRRIVMALEGLGKRHGYGEMMRANKNH